MSANASGVFGVGTDPPPERMDPKPYCVISVGSALTKRRSVCVIWPTFSASVIRPRRSLTRCLTGSDGFS